MPSDHEEMKDFSLPKSERLHSKKLIDDVFLNGQTIFLYPFNLKFLPAKESDSNQFLVTVSKKKFKKAVDRNLIKRRVREAYRLNKGEHLVRNQQSSYILIAYIYIAKEIHDYKFIESKLNESLKRLNSKLKNE